MTLSERAAATIVRTEVAAAAGLDPVAARLRVEQILGALELRPRGLPPRAILCVRELRDPLPGCVPLDGRRTSVPPAWEQAMQREIDRLQRASVRPGSGGAAAAAPAVVFDDEADLLACLGRDLTTGHFEARWWWPLLVEPQASPRRAVAAAWHRAIAHAPAALQRLAAQGSAVNFARALDPDDTEMLVVGLDRRFALARSSTPPADAPAVPGAWVAEPPPPTPWRDLVPEAEAPRLAPSQRLLLGTALALARAPAVARRDSFVGERAAWRAFLERVPIGSTAVRASAQPSSTAMTPPPTTNAAAEATPRDLVSNIPSSDGNDVRAVSRPTLLGDAVQPAITGLPDHASESIRAPEPARAALPTTIVDPRPSNDGSSAPTSEPPARDESPARSPEPAAPAGATAPEPAPAPAASTSPAQRKLLSLGARAHARGDAIETALGGLFYLINVGLYLGLYGDDQNLALPLWDFVALAGRALMGTRTAPASDDGIWPVLCALAGRAGDAPPGADFVPPLDWRLPPHWLAPFPAATAGAAVTDQRLSVVHERGFLVLDLPAAPPADIDAQLARELAAYPTLSATLDRDAPSSPPAIASPAPLSPLERWLAWLLSYLRARLSLALDVDPSAVGTALLEHRARVQVTDTHVDVTLSLDDLPVAIRLAGLDRDPGWVAAAGRFVAFHFEATSS